MNFETIPLYWVNRLSALSRMELGRRFRSADLNVSPEEWAILMLLWRQDGQSPGDMAARTVRDPTTMTRLIDGMVRKGFVHRTVDAGDRRRSNIHLTEQGRALEKQLIAVAKPMIKTALKGVSQADADTTIRVLSQMVENIASNNRKGKK